MNQRGITCKVTKTDGKSATIPVIIFGGYCTVDPSTKPYVTRDLIALAGVSEAVANKKFSALTEQERKAVLKLGENLDGTIVVDCAVEREAENVRSEAEKDAKNVFLRTKGFVWKKESRYISAGQAHLYNLPDSSEGDFVFPWILRGPDGQEVKISETLLTELGYYGEERKAELARSKERAVEIKAAKAEIEQFFAQTPHETPRECEPRGERIIIGRGFDPYGGGTEYLIEGEVALWTIRNNGRDGDDWSRNNYATGGAGAIASRYPYCQRIADLMRFVAE